MAGIVTVWEGMLLKRSSRPPVKSTVRARVGGFVVVVGSAMGESGDVVDVVVVGLER